MSRGGKQFGNKIINSLPLSDVHTSFQAL